MKRTAWPSLLVGGLCLALSGTSNAIGDIGGATTDFTSSTTPGAPYGNHALSRAKKKTELFTIYGYENIRSDVSRGSGEYLRSLGTLAGVPPDRMEEFQSVMQNSYTSMYDNSVPPRESVARVVEVAWSTGYGSR
jgi:Protein of unknown function (DUF3015)